MTAQASASRREEEIGKQLGRNPHPRTSRESGA